MAEIDKPVAAPEKPVIAEGGPAPTLGEMIAVFPKRNQDLFNYLINTFVSLLPQDKAAQFRTIAKEIERLLDEHTRAFITSLPPDLQAAALSTRDPRRSRFLLRLIVGRVSHLFAAKNPKIPKSVIEGLDQFFIKAFGPLVYEELNNEADDMFRGIPSGDDEEMWRQIKATPHWRRFADTILIRILFRFENFTNGKKTFMLIVGRVMQDMSKFTFGDSHFYMIFQALFGDLLMELKTDEQRLRVDFMFGDGTSAKLMAILVEGLQLKNKKGNIFDQAESHN
jgi:hypothetical protein